MRRSTTVIVSVVLTAALLATGISVWPAEARGRDYRVALLQCEANSNGGLVVSAASVTFDTDVEIYIGANCADTISYLVLAGMSTSYHQAVESDDNASFNFVFFGGP